MNTIQQSAVFHLTKCRDFSLHSMLLFLLLLIVFTESSNNKDLFLGTFFSLWPNGFFLETKLAIKNGHDFCISLYTFSFISLEIFFAFKLLLILCGDIEVNPSPGCWTSLFFCHWNLNSISAHHFAKVSLLEAYNATHKFDKICLFETFLNSSLQNDDDSLVLNGYKLVKADNPSDLKRGGVCISFKESLPIKMLNITNLHQCSVCKLVLNGRRSYIVSLYRSPSESSDQYDHFIKTFEPLIVHLTSSKPHLLLITGDFNARSSGWWSGDGDNTEGTRLESMK